MLETKQVTQRSIGLYPHQWDTLTQIAKDHNYTSLSGAVRYILSEYMDLKPITDIMQALNAGIIKEKETTKQLAILMSRNNLE